MRETVEALSALVESCFDQGADIAYTDAVEEHGADCPVDLSLPPLIALEH